MNITQINGTVTINGKTYTGNNIRIVNGEVLIDDNSNGTIEEKTINVTVTGNCQSVDNTSGDVTINGDAGSVKTVSGDVRCGGEVKGNVGTVSGDVECGKVYGSVNTVSGDVKGRG